MKVRLVIGALFLSFISMPLVSWATPIYSWQAPLEENIPVLPPSEPVTETNLCPAINLPAKTVIYLGFPGEKNPDAPSRFDIVFNYSNELKGGYLGWCVDLAHDIEKWAEHLVQLFSSCNWEALPSWIRGEVWKLRWNRINYILNHKTGANQEEIQNAIWAITNPEKKRKLSEKSRFLLAEAESKGNDFIPGKGQVVAIICLTEWGKQMVIFEMPIEEAAMVIPPTPPPVPAAAPPVVTPPVVPPIVPPVFPPGGDSPPDTPKRPVPDPLAIYLIGFGFSSFLIYRHVMGR